GAGRTVQVQEMIPEAEKGKKGTFGLRPEDIVVTKGDDAIFTGRVDIVEQLGEVTLLYVDCGNPAEPIVVKLDGIVPINKGDTVGLTAPIDKLHVFDENGKAYPRKE